MAGASYDRYNAYVALPQIERDGQQTKAAVVEVEGTVSEVQETVATKADSSTVTALSETVATKADSSTVTALSETVATKADSSTVTTLSGTVDTISGEVDDLTETVEGKADAEHEHSIEDITDVVDYITSQGTSGTWAYRKWHSGKIEAWGTVSTGTVAVTETSNLWRTAVQTASIPSGIFSSAPKIVITPNAETGVVGVNGNATSATSITWYGWGVNSNSRTFNFSVYAVS